jgi:hypothetical protein
VRSLVAYAGLALVVVSLPTGAFWLWTDPGVATGVTVAAGVAYGVMVASFAVMIRFRGRGDRFLAAWAGGVLTRLLTLGVATYAVMRVEGLAPAPTLLALAGFFFMLLLLEPVYLREREPRIGLTDRTN